MTESNPTGSPSTPATDPPANRRPRPNLTAPPLRVQSPTPSTPTTTASRLSDPLDGDGPADTGTPSSDPASTPAAVKVDRDELHELGRNAVLAASGVVHERLATTDEARAAQVWIADDGDQAQIGHPLADLLARYGVPRTAVNPDVADLIAAGIGVVTYLVKNGLRAWRLHMGRRRLADLDPITEQPQEA